MDFKIFKEIINGLPDNTETVTLYYGTDEYIFDMYHKDTPLEVDEDVMAHMELRFE